MAVKNISKYVQLTDFVLLEYEFNKEETNLNLPSSGITPKLANTTTGFKQYFNEGGIGVTNNTPKLNSVALNSKRNSWFLDTDTPSNIYNYFDSSTAISNVDYPHDTVKVHVVSGYNFDDIAGFLLQIRAQDASGGMVTLSNFTWVNQVLGDSVNKFSANSLHLGNKFFDKYLELKIPSIQQLGGDTVSTIGQALNIKAVSDVYITYSAIPDVDGTQYIISEIMELQLPVSSPADNFNAFITESTAGDYIEYYATWKDVIIGEYISDIESGRIKLYTSNNPNDNFEDFSTLYGVNANKWVVNHEILVYEHLTNNTLLTQKFMFTQEDSFSEPNKFRPVLKNSDIASSFSIDYICRLTNRMDGTQIIRKASFASKDPQKYGKYFTRLNVDNIIPYNVYNKIDVERPQEIVNNESSTSQFIKVLYNVTNVLLLSDNTVFPDGTGPLFIKKGDSNYKFKFERIRNQENPQNRENVDLSGGYDYVLLFNLDTDKQMRVSPTYSENMSAALGELEFKLSSKQTKTLLKQNNNAYSIVIKNPNGSEYVFYEGLYYDNINYNQVISQYQQLYNITELNAQISDLQKENDRLQNELNTLKSN